MTVAQPTTDTIATKPKRRSKIREGLELVLTSRIATIGLAMVLFWVILAFVSLFWTPADPNASLFAQNIGPNAENWLGTDSLGRDLLSRLMTGGQVILLKTRVPDLRNFAFLLGGFIALFSLVPYLTVVFKMAEDLSKTDQPKIVLAIPALILAPILVPITWIWGWLKAKEHKLSTTMTAWTVLLVLIGILYTLSRLGPEASISIPGGVAIWGVLGSLAVGSLFGLNAGYRGGWADQIIMQVLDAMIAFPRIVLYLVVIAALGQGDFVIILAITITGAPGVARLARSLALDIKTRDYIRAAETRGESVWYIMFREILPNARGPLIVDGMLRVGYAIFTIATLGFLGIGLPPPDPDWGNMVDDARTFVRVTPWPLLWPAFAISTLVIGLNLFADGVREELTRYQK